MPTSYSRYGDYICMGEDLIMPEFIDYVYALALLAILALVVVNLVLIFKFSINGVSDAKIFFHPKLMYLETKKVNRFGAWLACILHNICCVPHALWFWVYYACTVGRPE